MMEFITNWYWLLIVGVGAIVTIILIVEFKNVPTIDMPDACTLAAAHNLTIDDVQDVLRDLRDSHDCPYDDESEAETSYTCTCNKYDLIIDSLDELRVQPNKTPKPQQGCSFDEDLYPNGRDFDEAVAKDEADFNAPISKSALNEIGNFGQFAEDRMEVQPSDFPDKNG